MELLGSIGCGPVIVEMALALTGLPHTVTDIPYMEPGPARERLLALNPLGQVPTLVLDDGTVMTETAAILLYLHDLAPQAGLAPAASDADRARFLHLLILIVAAIYPTYTYGDFPERWTLPGEASARLVETTSQARKDAWVRVEASAAPAPYLLGARFSSLDLYLVAMTRWQPKQAWFSANTPKLAAAATAAAAFPALRPILQRHFGNAKS